MRLTLVLLACSMLAGSAYAQGNHNVYPPPPPGGTTRWAPLEVYQPPPPVYVPPPQAWVPPAPPPVYVAPGAPPRAWDCGSWCDEAPR